MEILLYYAHRDKATNNRPPLVICARMVHP